MVKRYIQFDPPSDHPALVCLGCAVGLWGLSLLFSSLPPLMCMPAGPRALRLAALGINLGASLIGLLEFVQSAPVAGTGVSFGFVVGYAISLFARAFSRVNSKKHQYSRLSVSDEDDAGGNDDDTSDGVQLTGRGNKPEDNEIIIERNIQRPIIYCEGLALTSAIAYFAIVRGVLLGSAIYRVGGRPLEARVICTIGQIALAAGGLSVTLTDAQFPLARSAFLSVVFSFMGPLGVGIGALTGEKGEGVYFQLFSAFVAGVLLFQTAATKLPLEIRDSDDEWRHKGAGKGFWSNQFMRLGALLTGWILMASMHWPELVVDMEEIGPPRT